ncbi:MAG: 2'-5' RNA ligase family protein [Bryobacteraceae bacterium]
MMDIQGTSPWGFFALVSYIPDPLGSFLHGLRRLLPGEDNPQAHITILPPRPLKLPVESVSKCARKILQRFPAFDVELSKVRCFPGTNLIYLDIGQGNALLHELHAALNTGDLNDAEELEFRPHLTLGGPVPRAKLVSVRQQAQSAWRAVHFPRTFKLDEVVFLWVSPNGPHGEWDRLWSQRLTTNGESNTAVQPPAAASQTF